MESASSRASHNPNAVVDLTLATFTDVAVMRCLFIPQWVEEGVFWAVQFLFYRSVHMLKLSYWFSKFLCITNHLEILFIYLQGLHLANTNKK